MDTWMIGKVSITRVVEVVAQLPPEGLITEATPDALSEYRSWLHPHFIDDDGNMLLSIHAFAVRSGDLQIVIDTCIGESQREGSRLTGSGDQTDFLERLDGVGFAPDSVDRVLCTHLHFDHIGWNTRLQGGNWVPTFPNARYLIGREEWAYWQDSEDQFAPEAKNESVQPILDASLADLVEVNHQVTDEISLIPTPGHTPGHVSVLIDSAGEQAIITGDMFHHPLQFAHPEWTDIADESKELARETRERFIATYADSDVTVLGTHFAAPTAGRIVRDGDRCWFAV